MTAALVPCVIASAASLTDYDQDGLISRIEFESAVAEIAAAADVNGDGLIDGTEFPWTEADKRLFDNDSDGKITAVGIQEFRDGMNLAFNALDTDMNDVLDAAELKAGANTYGVSFRQAGPAAGLSITRPRL
jgi:hypothetical protein